MSKIVTVSDLEKEYSRVVELLNLTESERDEIIGHYNYLYELYAKLQEDYKNLSIDYQRSIEKNAALTSRLVPFTTQRKITDAQVKEIINLRAEGKSFSQIRKLTGWSNVTINRCLNGVYGIE